MNAKTFLRQLKKLDRMIENKQKEREHWLEMATSTTAGAAPDTGVRVQSSGSKQRMADAVISSIAIDEDIGRAIVRLYEARKEIIGVIEQLPVVEYDVLHCMYVGRVETDKHTGRKITVYLSLQDVADEFGKSYSWATTVHGTALSGVQRIIDAQQVESLDSMIKRWNNEKL